MTTLNTQWIELIQFPMSTSLLYKIIKLNEFEFIRWSSDTATKIHKYNIFENKWNEWIIIPRKYCCSIGALIFNQNQSKLFFHFHYFSSEYCIETKIIKIYDNNIPTALFERGILINNTYHIIGGLSNRSHLVWNKQKKIFEQYNFEEIKSICRHKLIYLKSKNIVLCFGGLKDTHNIEMSSNHTNQICLFDTQSFKWTKLVQTLPNVTTGFGCIQSRNDEYIIIFGGHSLNETTDKISVLKTNNMKFIECTIRCPIKGYFDAINMNDSHNEELMTFGYIRKLLIQFNDLLYLPVYLIKIIRNYISIEIIHLLESNVGYHWKINIDQIVANC